METASFLPPINHKIYDMPICESIFARWQRKLVEKPELLLWTYHVFYSKQEIRFYG